MRLASNHHHSRMARLNCEGQCDMTREFQHYDGCKHNDPDNCSACALTDLRQDSPNYAAWPLAYMENNLCEMFADPTND